MYSILLIWALAGQIGGPELKPEVDALVRELDAEDVAARRDAEKRLIELGAKVLPLLPRVDDQTPGEVKYRLDRVREVLEKQLAAEAVQGARVTLKGSMKLSQALAAIEEQTKNHTLDLRGRFGQQATDPTIEVDFKDELYWRALDQVLDQGELKVYNYSGEPRTIGLVAREEGELPRSNRASYSGMFRVEGTRLRSERNLRSGAAQPLRLTAEVHWEPRVIPIQLRQPLNTLKVVDDQGNEIAIDSDAQELQVSAQATVSGVEFVMPLELPDRSVQHIASLEGKIYALVPGKDETFRFANIDTIKKYRINKAGLAVTLEAVRGNGAITEIRVRVRMDDADESMQSHLDWVSNNEAYLLDADDNRLDETPNIERYASTRNEVGVAYLFPVSDVKGHTFVYKSPAAILDMEIDFKLSDIPLP